MSLERRLSRAEERTYRLLVAQTMAECGLTDLTVDEVLEEAEDFLSLPLAEQLRQVDALQAELAAHSVPWDEAEHIKAELARLYRPMT
jgi:hypothetical protein